MMPDVRQNGACCFTGHRPEHLPWGREETGQLCSAYYKKLWRAIEEQVDAGCRIFYCGMAQGVDTMAAQIVLGLREDRPELALKLIAVCPHRDQATRWSAKDKSRHAVLLGLADEVVILSETYIPSCYHQRNRYMVDRSDVVIAGFDGITRGGTASTVAYARKKGRRIVLVPPV